MIDVTEIVFDARDGAILEKGVLSETLKKLDNELKEAGQESTKPTPMRIIIRIGA